MHTYRCRLFNRLFTRPWGTLLALMAALLLTLALPGSVALAHANLVRSDPPHGASLAASPPEVVLEFSETLDSNYTAVMLVDSTAKMIAPGPGQLDPNNAKILHLSIPKLADGTYSAVWRARSLVDGHLTQGVVSFSVGASTPPVSLLLPPTAPEPASVPPEPVETIIRWIGYLTAALAVGSFAFGVLVWRLAFGQAADDAREASLGLTRLVCRAVVVGGVGLLAATLALLILQASQVSGASFPGVLGNPLLQIVAGRSGVLAGVRLVLVVAMIAAALRLGPAGGGSSRLWWAGLALGAALLITFSLQSHSAAQGLPLEVFLDWVHLLAMSIWVGGLVMLALVIGFPRISGYQGHPPLLVLIPHFSSVALVAVLILGFTGLINAVVQVGTLEALTGTTYGLVLMVKAGLFAILIGLGAINLLVLTPRLADPAGRAARQLRWTTRAEILLVGVVLLAAGALTASTPARQALDAERQLGFIEHASHDGVDMRLIIAPARVGEDEFGVDVADHRPGASAAPAQVLLRFKSLSVSTGETQVATQTGDQARFTARGSYLSLGGDWQVLLIVRRPGFDDVTQTFFLSLAGAPLAVGTPFATVEPDYPNPVPANADSIARGKTLFEANCLPCHGATGKGDGPVGLTLNPRPADLTVHTQPGVHTDAQLYEWITNGYKGSAMPAFKDALTDDDRWSLVNYIRTLWKPAE